MTKASVSFPVALVAALKAAKMSQADLARTLGVSRAAVSDWVAGRKVPRRAMVDKINAALGVNLSPVRPITVREFARDMGCGVATIRRGLNLGLFTEVGVAIPSQTGKRHSYVFYPQKYKEFVNAGP